MEIDIIEASEVDRYKDGKKDAEEEEEEKPETKLDILDDPVRMYLKQMGQVPLLTREQEVEISKRIEEAEAMVQRCINRFGFIAQAHLDLAAKLTEGGERFDRVILDKKIESRERYMKMLPRLCKQVEKLSGSISHAVWSGGARRRPNGSRRNRRRFRNRSPRCSAFIPSFISNRRSPKNSFTWRTSNIKVLLELKAEAAKKSARPRPCSRRSCAESRRAGGSALAIAGRIQLSSTRI